MPKVATKDDTAKYIDGSWYEEEYGNSDKWYHKEYIGQEIPAWAKDSNQHCADLTIMITGLGKGSRILELGCGVGRQLDSFNERGMKAQGIEISPSAAKHGVGEGRDIVACSAVKLPFKNNEFDLVYSNAFLEHIDNSILDDVFKEAARVSRRQVHFIGMDKGTDPSHINIKTGTEWFNYFEKMSVNRAVLQLADFISDDLPYYVIAPFDMFPHQVGKWVHEMTVGKP